MSHIIRSSVDRKTHETYFQICGRKLRRRSPWPWIPKKAVIMTSQKYHEPFKQDGGNETLLPSIKPLMTLLEQDFAPGDKAVVYRETSLADNLYDVFRLPCFWELQDRLGAQFRDVAQRGGFVASFRMDSWHGKLLGDRNGTTPSRHGGDSKRVRLSNPAAKVRFAVQVNMAAVKQFQQKRVALQSIALFLFWWQLMPIISLHSDGVHITRISPSRSARIARHWHYQTPVKNVLSVYLKGPVSVRRKTRWFSHSAYHSYRVKRDQAWNIEPIEYFGLVMKTVDKFSNIGLIVIFWVSRRHSDTAFGRRIINLKGEIKMWGASISGSGRSFHREIFHKKNTQVCKLDWTERCAQ